jgi:hypothetical protein
MILMYGWGYSQSNTFSAKFRSLVNGEPVLYAKVTNSTGESLLTNVDGLVTILYEPNSEITISHLVYDTLKILPSEFEGRSDLVFYLQPRTYDLREVKFSILGERSVFDRKFVSNNLGKSDQEKVREKLRIIEMKKELIGLDRSAQGGVVLGSPITYLYDRFSKSGRERREYAVLLAKDRQRKETGKKFDDFVVSTLTSFEDDELVRFKAFCSFHPSFIELVDELTLYYEILRCRTEFIEKGY